MYFRLAALLTLCCLSAGAQERTPLILGFGTYLAPHDGRHDGQDHGLQAATYCGASPESWVRGSAALNPETSWLSLTLELETDSPQAGPKGRLSVTLSKGCLRPVHGGCDALHDPLVKLYTVETDEVSIGGRSRGGDTGIIRRSASVDIPDNVARQVTHVAVQAECTGSGTQWSGWTSLQDAENAFEATGRPAGASQLQ
ncbi:MAG TPA: hypothetical protein VGM02_00650 [Acidobacteriaceae bacterium]|jgi:hypothetical protein